MATVKYEVSALEKAIRLLDCLTAAPSPMGVSEISRAVGLNKNMVFRLLFTLKETGWVIEEEGPRYRVSLQPFHLFSRPLSRLGVRTAAEKPLRSLWETTGESCYLAVLDDRAALFIEHWDSTRDVRTAARVGGRYELHCCAPGKVLLAHADDKLIDEVLAANLQPNTVATQCDPDALREELGCIQRQCYALDLEEYCRGLLCFAAPIFDHADQVAGSVGVGVLTLHYSQAEMISQLGPKVMRVAAEISKHLGASDSVRTRLSIKIQERLNT